MTEQELIQLFGGALATSPLLGIAYLLYKTGILQAWASRISGGMNPMNDRITDLESFQATAEGNHFHDLEDLKIDRKEIWVAINGMRSDFNDYRVSAEGRMSRLEAKGKNSNHT